MLLRNLTCALALLALPLVACASSKGGGSGGAGGSTSISDPELCNAGPHPETYTLGLSATSTDKKIKVSFVDANPAPPEKGLNSWTIQVTDAQGKPVSGANISLVPFMPEHGHGSSITPQIMPMSQAGQYLVTLIDLFMPGVWQNTFTITPPSGTPETVVFNFCIDG
jgi:hypothetical protein